MRKHPKLRLRLAVFVVTVLVLGLAAPALAARGEKTQLWITESNPYTLGEQLDFASSNTRYDYAWIVATCYQDDLVVYQEWHGLSEDGAYGPFTFGPNFLWQDGDADCEAEVGYFHRSRFKTEAKMSFHVYGEQPNSGLASS